jgi:hypothetical protein
MYLWSCHLCIGEAFRTDPAVALPNPAGGAAGLIVEDSRYGKRGRAEWLSKANSSMTMRQVKASEERLMKEARAERANWGFSLHQGHAERQHLVAISRVASACTYLLYGSTVRGTQCRPFCS